MKLNPKLSADDTARAARAIGCRPDQVRIRGGNTIPFLIYGDVPFTPAGFGRLIAIALFDLERDAERR